MAAGSATRLRSSPALEERFPERALYPADDVERARALDLEDYFDEHVGPAARHWGFSALLTEPEAVREFAIKQTEWAPFSVPTAAFSRPGAAAPAGDMLSEPRHQRAGALEVALDQLVGARLVQPGSEFVAVVDGDPLEA